MVIAQSNSTHNLKVDLIRSSPFYLLEVEALSSIDLNYRAVF